MYGLANSSLKSNLHHLPHQMGDVYADKGSRQLQN